MKKVIAKQKRTDEVKPYIDYKVAKIMTRMYDFINHANYKAAKITMDLDAILSSIHRLQERLSPVEDPNDFVSGLKRDHFPNLIQDIRHDAWELGMTDILFEKLKDRKFRNRFEGWLQPPVSHDEIEDQWEDEAEPERDAIEREIV
jgi:hypothetical protein